MNNGQCRWMSAAAAALVCALLLVSAAGAEEQPAERTEQSLVGDEALLFQDLPSVTTASRYEQKSTEAPASITVITADDIRRYGYRTLADILRSVRSFVITYDRAYSFAGVRGFGRLGDYNSRVLLLLDGHRLNEVIYDSIGLGTEGVVDVDLIDRVEVVRGPGSSLYGSNAFFAVVNIITRRGRDLQGMEVSGEAASYDTLKGRYTFGGRLKNGSEHFLSASIYDSGGQRLYFPEYDFPATNHGIAEHSDGDAVRSFFVKTTLRNVTVEAAYSERTKQDPTGAYGTDFNDPRNQSTDKRGFIDALFQRGIGGRTDLSARVFYDTYAYLGDYLYGGVVNKDEAYGVWWGGDLRVVTRSLAGHRLVLGTEYQANIRQDQKNYDTVPSFTYADDHQASRQYAFYAQDEVPLAASLTLNAGIRYDRYDTFGGATNPRLGLIYAPDRRSSVKLLYGTAFRAPNVYELYYSTPPYLPNPDLDPERIRTAELVYERLISEQLRGTMSFYSSTIDNLIDASTDGSGSWIFLNTSRVRSRGAEAEIEGRLTGGIEFRASYGYQDSEDASTGAWLTNSPRHVAKAGLLVPLMKDAVFAGVEEQYVSKRRTYAGTEVGGAAVMNLTLSARRLAKGLDISASVYNLFDRQFFDPVSPDHMQPAIEQDGRSWRLKVTYAF